MSVILDWVANHTSWDHEWMSTPTWYAKNGSGEMFSPNGWNDAFNQLILAHNKLFR